MSAIYKEKIFEELRNYHTRRLPAKIENPQVDDLRTKFNLVEDRIVGMILSLVNGKTEFVDSTKELNTFETALNSMPANSEDEANKNIFVSKIKSLGEIMIMARESDFKLRKVRGAKPA